MFHHSNWRLPIGLERRLVCIVVTPRMHGIHHSVLKDEANSNYSVIFSLWDRVHGSLRLYIRQSDVTIGVAAYSGEKDNGFLRLLAMPFTVQLPYDRWPDGSPAAREAGQENVGSSPRAEPMRMEE